MELHTEIQGSTEWAALRSRYYTASNAAAMMGCHPTKQRNELLRETKTGIAVEVSDFVESRVFAPGHATEAAARPLAEAEVGEDLYPVVGSLEVEGLPLLASFDGLSLDYSTGYEHKLYSEEIASHVAQVGEPPLYYVWQLEQQLLVSGGQRILFVTSDGTPEKWAQCWYISKPARRAALISGWKQFSIDVATYVPTEKPAPVVAAPVETLPAVSVKVDGALAIVSNLPAFGEALRKFIGKIPEQPSTDQEFADTEAACKALKRAEEALEAAETNALAQLSDVDTMRRFVADFKALARTTRLQREKLVAQRKESIKGELVAAGVAAMAKHIRELNAAMPADYMPQVPADFGGCIKGLRTVDSIRNAVDTELARVKIMANEIANRIHANVKTLKDSGLVVHDAAALVLKQPDDLAAVIAQRVAAEKAKEEAQRERIRAEEAARLEREAAAKAAAEKAEADRLERQRAHAAQVEADRIAHEQAEAASAARIRDELIEKQMRHLDHAEDAAIVAISQPAMVAFEHSMADAATTGMGIVSMSSESVTRIDPATVIDDDRRLTLGQLNTLLSPVSISVAGLEVLGFKPVERVKNSCLYRLSDTPKICLAIAQHVREAAFELANA